MVSIVDIIVPIVVGIIILGVSFYLFIMYCHPEEKGFGTAIFPKILVVVSQTLAWGQLLLLPLDLSVTSSDPSSNFELVYDVVYPVIFFVVAFLNPFMSNLYQSDEQDTMVSRVCWSFLFSSITAACWCAGVFISYIWLSIYTVNGVQYQLPIPIYIFLCMSFVGFILLALNGGIGLAFLPYDLILSFVQKPKQLTAAEALSKKSLLQNQSSELITMGQKLKDSQTQLDKKDDGWWARRKKQSNFRSQLDDFKLQINKLEAEYEIFDEEIKVVKAHPILYIVYLILGIFATIASVAWLIQLIGTGIYVNMHPLFLFLDQWMSELAVGDAAFVATMLFGIMTLYLQACVVKGNTIFGLRIPFLIKFHPLRLNKTYMNSLIFNSTMMMLASVATSMLCVYAFPTYLSKTYLSIITKNAIQLEPLFNVYYGKRIPLGLLALVFVVVLLFIFGRLIWKCCKKQEDPKEKPKVKQDS